MLDCKPIFTSIELAFALLSLNQDSPNTNLRLQYQIIIGSLMYNMIEKRPDLAFSIFKLSQYSNNPQDAH